MSSVLTRPGAPSAPAAAHPAAVHPDGPVRASRRDSQLVRLTAFAALATFGAAHWAGLVADASTGRMLLVVIVATAGAVALALLGPLPGRLRFPLAALVTLVTLALGLLAAGLQVRLLLPGGLNELIDGVDRGLGGVRTVNWPYEGDDPWVRLTILLGAPLLLGVAAGLAFWPVRRGVPVLRGAGLVALLLLYGVAVTEHDPGRPLLNGFVLLFLVAAWLWLPRLEPREALSGAAAVLAVGVVAIPFSVQLDGSRPWWDYRSFDWFGQGKVVSFDWRHSYGPLDWPRDGTTLMNVRSRKPHYWKAETLDLFSGFRWERAGPRPTAEATRRAYGELPRNDEPEGRNWDYFEFNPAWDAGFRVTVRALRSDLIIGAGNTRRVIGAGTTEIAADGTTHKLSDPLEQGDTYFVRAYVPTPTAAQMRGAPQRYATSLLPYTATYVPRTGDGTLPGGSTRFERGRGTPPSSAVFAPLRGGTAGSPASRRELLRSPYRRVYRLARRLTAGRGTVYDAVKSVETHLKRNYRYNERPPTRRYPLASFLLKDRIGYCQQFSGAMALMLRLAGIPARVATGFTRGSFNRDSGEYRVRDLDAHSWVEVHFTGIGWVAFDPTPPATPAEGQEGGSGGAGGPPQLGGDSAADAARSDRSGGADASAGASGGLPGWLGVLGLLAAAAVAAGGLLALRVARQRRALVPLRRAQAQLDELRAALPRLGWRLPAGTTLLALERRLRRAAGPAAAGYAARLRANRYDPDPPEPPGLGHRRALRRELGSAAGPRGRLRALLAIPPWGPKVR